MLRRRLLAALLAAGVPVLALAAPSNGPPLMVKNGGSTLGPAVTLNCAAGTSCTKTGSQVDLKAVAGSTTQLIYNNAGALAGDANLTWNGSVLNVGQASVLTANPLAIAGNTNGYVQGNIQNKSNGASASSDWIATADTGNDTTNYVDFGINSSAYSDSSYTIVGALDSYLYSNGGHLAIGTQTAAKNVVFHTGGTLSSNLRATLSDAALTLASGTSLVLPPATAVPTAPSSGLLSFAHDPVTTSGPSFPAYVEAVTGSSFSIFPFIGGGHGYWGCLTPSPTGSNSINVTGVIASVPANAATSAAFSNSTYIGRLPRVLLPTAASANSNGGTRMGGGGPWRGNAAGLGGWAYWVGWNTNASTAGQRVMVGLAASSWAGTSDPNAQVNAVYFGCNAGGSNLNICSNDASGTATCIDLGASYPCVNTSAVYNGYLWAAPNGSTIGWAIERMDSAASTSGSLSTDLPVNTVQLLPQAFVNTGAGTSAVQLAFLGACLWANP